MDAVQILDLSMIKSFQSVLGNAKHIVVLTGAAHAAESSTCVRTQVCLSQLSLLSTMALLRHLLCLYIGAGTSAESGIPTFRGAGGLWRQYEATDLGTINTTKVVSRISCHFFFLQRPRKPSLKTLHWSGSFTTGAVRFESHDGNIFGFSTPAGPCTAATVLAQCLTGGVQEQAKQGSLCSRCLGKAVSAGRQAHDPHYTGQAA